MKPLDAITEAIEKSIAWHYDPLAGDPDWSINPAHFWMALAETGYVVVPDPKRHNDGSVHEVQ